MGDPNEEMLPPASTAVEAGGTFCLACGASAEAGQRFCGQCGASLALACSVCRASNPPDHRFCGQCGTPLTAAPPIPRPPERAVAAPREERRWATVLFADLSGFTSMAERMDPEDVQALVHRCAERLAEHVRRFGGTVTNVMGDGVLAVFGAPLSHEDDAERAVRAGLAMRDCSLSDDPAQPIQLHIGINTGDVFAGLVGPEERRDYTVTGDTVNTTDRLASAAPAGSVLVGEETYRATQRVVRYRELAPVVAKGKEQPVPAWEALAVADLPAARPLGTAPLVGRQAELAQLSDLYRKATQEAQPHLVTVIGEAGIGKSRLVAEFEQACLSEAKVIHGRCLPYGQVLGYWALAAALKEAAGIGEEEDAATARARLGDLVASALTAEEPEERVGEVARHLAVLSGLDVAKDRGERPVDQRTLHASCCRFLEAFARRQALCLMLEDIHWADEALLDLIEFVASRAQGAPLLILTQARPQLLEKRPTWGQRVPAFTTVALEPLDEHAGRELILALCRERGVAEEVAERVGHGSGGNPLFAEELVATVAERGGATGIPSVIKALISARLDALPPEERSVLQLGAVLGKQFWQGGLRALGAPGAVPEHLESLTRRDLLRSQPRSLFPGDQEYAFKHDLIRDVAYETLPRAERRRLHGRVADWIEQATGERVEGYFDLLAYHALQAEQQERALKYLTRAAERAQRAAAHRQEAALLAQAIAIAERLQLRDQVAELHARRGKALASVALWREARPELEEALKYLATEQKERRAEILAELARVCYWTFDAPALRRHATEAMQLAKQQGRADLEIAAMTWHAASGTHDGDLASVTDGSRQTLARAAELGLSPLPQTYSFYAAVLYWTGQYSQAIEYGKEAVRLARAAQDWQTTLQSLHPLVGGLAGVGRYAEAIQALEEGRRLGREYGIHGDHARCTAILGGIHLDLFDFTAAEALAEEAREMATSAGFVPPVFSAGIDLMLNFARRQEPERAERLVDSVAAGVAAGVGAHRWHWQIRLAQARAEIALARGNWEEAIRWAEDAIAQSRAMGRVKYVVAGLGTRGKALAALGRKHEGVVDTRSAVELARPTGDPAMFLRAALALLEIEADEALAAEARATANRIAAALPDDAMRRRFRAAEPLRRLGG
jgi:class 3 adenylate cyclase/tetratricopeptide (TPR) repeat protein